MDKSKKETPSKKEDFPKRHVEGNAELLEYANETTIASNPSGSSIVTSLTNAENTLNMDIAESDHRPMTAMSVPDTLCLTNVDDQLESKIDEIKNSAPEPAENTCVSNDVCPLEADNCWKQFVTRYTLAELQGLCNDPDACIKCVSDHIYICIEPVEPVEFEYLQDAVNDKIGSYDAKLQGFVLDVRNVKIKGNKFSIHNDGLMYIDVLADIYVFAPRQGAVFKGIIKKIAQQRVFVCIYRLWLFRAIMKSGPMHLLAINDEISIKIKKLGLTLTDTHCQIMLPRPAAQDRTSPIPTEWYPSPNRPVALTPSAASKIKDLLENINQREHASNMMCGPIFANNIAETGSTGGFSHLIEFKAGRMNMVGKMVHPDHRKGLIYLYFQAEDGLIHFCWKDRNYGIVEEDRIIIPDCFEFKRVDQCKTGRVYLLLCKLSSLRLFFWMQEPKTDKDDEFCRRVNDIMNNPPSATTPSSDDDMDMCSDLEH